MTPKGAEHDRLSEPAAVVDPAVVAGHTPGSAEAAPPADRSSDVVPPARVAHAAPPADTPLVAALPAGGPETPSRLVIVFAPDAPSPPADAPPPGVTAERRPVAGPVSTFAGVGELARAVGQAVAGGAHGVVVVHPAETLAETAWALELVHDGTAPIVLTAASGAPAAFG